ncbi:MAG: DUF3887 domain-containing protein [Gomphosphaeria aponina SAG 52.96 = DSM 107014]|uniref:DUF3887 domain-containing protein n=1 Tax=Gomphosphaeria aponina SAG 52.96 = DSM 107014 TaxID=1521640 RepID=A0A941JRT2_9CHRO|nr:DUF3887 domain-containing protein [Gomphosphaeria aponina SAG 52.96 = DSM 107014]
MNHLYFKVKSWSIFLLTVCISAGINPTLAQFPNEKITQITQSENEASAEELQEKATMFIGLLTAEDYGQAREYFHPNLKAEWPGEKLQQVWENLLSETGAVQQQLNSRVTRTVNADIVFVSVEFEKLTEDILVTFNQEKQIIGVDFPSTETIQEIAEKVVAALAAEDFASARSYLHPFLKTEIFPQEVQAKWQALQARTGPFQRQVSSEVRSGSSTDDVDVVLVTVEFEKVTDDLIFMFNEQKQIVGIDLVQFQDEVGDF